MRHRYAILFAPAICMAQAPAPAISFDKTHHDFGRVPHGQKVSYRYKVQNKGSAPLKIIEIRPSCGCSYSVAGQWALKPGEGTYIEVSFDPAGMIGTAHKSLSVISDDPDSPDTLLTFEASVIREIMPSTTAIFFDKISRSGPPLSKTVRLQSGDGKKIVVTDAKIPGAPYLSCTPRGEGSDVILNIAIDGGKIPKKAQRGVDNLAVRTTSREDPVLHFHIQWDVQGDIVATPDRVTWSGSAGSEMRATVALAHSEGRPFRILEAKSTSTLISAVGIGKGSAAEHKFDVVLSSRARAAGYHELLTLKLDDPGQESLEIAVVAILR